MFSWKIVVQGDRGSTEEGDRGSTEEECLPGG